MDTRIPDTLRQARDTLATTGWVQSTVATLEVDPITKRVRFTQVCQQGALLGPIGYRTGPSDGSSLDGRSGNSGLSVSPRDPDLYLACCVYMGKAIVARFPERAEVFLPATVMVARFNDHEDTQLADVLTIFDDAIVLSLEDLRVEFAAAR